MMVIDKLDVMELFLQFLESLDKYEQSIWFLKPVDPNEVPGYYDTIKNPMSIQDMIDNIRRGCYRDVWEVVNHFWLMLENCSEFNKKRNKVVRKAGLKMQEVFLTKGLEVMRKAGYCCIGKYYYEPKVLLCNTKSVCDIPENVSYYKANTMEQEFIACVKCYKSSSTGIELADSRVIPKDWFVEVRNNIRIDETFVNCSKCNRRWHKVCALSWSDNEFVCNFCKFDSLTGKMDRLQSSEMITMTQLSRFLEFRVNEYLQSNVKSKSWNKVIIRDFTNSDCLIEFKPKMSEKFRQENIEPFEYKSRAIYAFQNIDGADVVFFGLHTQEFPSDIAGPNRSSVYITYIDSVPFFQPKPYRTSVYRTIILSYLDFVRHNNMATAHLWICPSEAGNDYIFFRHPTEQKMPLKDRLMAWYDDLFREGIEKKIIDNVENISEYYKSINCSKLTDIAYFSGDHWPNVLEELLIEFEKDIEFTNELNNSQNHFKPMETTPKTKNRKRKLKSKSVANIERRKIDTNNFDLELKNRLFELINSRRDEFMTVRLKKLTSDEMVFDGEFDFRSDNNFDGKTCNCELMMSRDSLLPFCKENNYEFSSLRRAKYSTTKLLVEIFSDNSQKSDIQKKNSYFCNACSSTDLLIRHHCDICKDFDLCDSCFETQVHEHYLVSINEGNVHINNSSEQITLQQLSTLIIHSSSCYSNDCHVPFCSRLKKYFVHCAECLDERCFTCLQVHSALAAHYHSCKLDDCNVILCIAKRKDEERKANQRNFDRNLFAQKRNNSVTNNRFTSNGTRPIDHTTTQSLETDNKPIYQHQVQAVVAKVKEVKRLYPENEQRTQFSRFMVENPQLIPAFEYIKKHTMQKRLRDEKNKSNEENSIPSNSVDKPFSVKQECFQQFQPPIYHLSSDDSLNSLDEPPSYHNKNRQQGVMKEPVYSPQFQSRQIIRPPSIKRHLNNDISSNPEPNVKKIVPPRTKSVIVKTLADKENNSYTFLPIRVIANNNDNNSSCQKTPVIRLMSGKEKITLLSTNNNQR